MCHYSSGDTLRNLDDTIPGDIIFSIIRKVIFATFAFNCTIVIKRLLGCGG